MFGSDLLLLKWIVDPVWSRLQPKVLRRWEIKGQGSSVLEWPTQNNIVEKVIELF